MWRFVVHFWSVQCDTGAGTLFWLLTSSGGTLRVAASHHVRLGARALLGQTVCVRVTSSGLVRSCKHHGEFFSCCLLAVAARPRLRKARRRVVARDQLARHFLRCVWDAVRCCAAGWMTNKVVRASCLLSLFMLKSIGSEAVRTCDDTGRSISTQARQPPPNHEEHRHAGAGAAFERRANHGAACSRIPTTLSNFGA